MIEIYECEFCGNRYEHKDECSYCETSCEEYNEKAKKLGKKLVEILKELEKLDCDLLLMGDDICFGNRHGFFGEFTIKVSKDPYEFCLEVDRELK